MEYREIIKDKLWSIVYDGESETALENAIKNMIDAQWRLQLLKENEKCLSYYRLSIESASNQAFQEILEIVDLLYNHTDDIDDFFHPLKNTEVDDGNKVLMKNKGFVVLDNNKKGIVRIYAIKLEPSYYVITGGTIKLTKDMQDLPHTNKEFENLELSRNYLQKIGVFDKASMIDKE